MIGLAFITQMVYWYRDFKNPELAAESKKRHSLKTEAEKMVEPTSEDFAAPEHLTSYVQPWPNEEYDCGHVILRVIPESNEDVFATQEYLGLNLYDNRIAIPERM